jgi:hypothetical protein
MKEMSALATSLGFVPGRPSSPLRVLRGVLTAFA